MPPKPKRKATEQPEAAPAGDHIVAPAAAAAAADGMNVDGDGVAAAANGAAGAADKSVTATPGTGIGQLKHYVSIQERHESEQTFKLPNPLVCPMMTDFYQITMAYAYWRSGKQ